jgi:Barstar (barnase inhibitor)
VAAFDLDADINHPADFDLFQNGGCALYQRRSVLAEARTELEQLGYVTRYLDAQDWGDERLHDDFATAFDFPSYYGRNFNALRDCLSDVAHGDYGWPRAATGLAVTVDNFGTVVSRERDFATLIADVLVTTTRYALLFGHRLIWQLQVDDGDVYLEHVGCLVLPWNRREWLTASRRRD